MTGIATCAHASRTMMASALYTDKYDLNAKGKARLDTLTNRNPDQNTGTMPDMPGTYIKPIVRSTKPELDRAIYYW